ncbi:histidine phosphatase family protein [Microbacterium sp. EST19A]|uniref:histidine phosphatase family protein n=1 Tax=Microbacterium sp. EST19A TaxID=2862681 RepID=UPI001CBFB9BC|nr:histidine phosphatase family protein [Microbacterium sp. EST19A]
MPTIDPLPDRPAPDNPTGKLVLLRHGETEWSRAGLHTGLTDVPLTPRGEDLARGAGELVADYDFSLVLTSPLQRARRTAELAGLHADVDPLLVEWDYGGYEGRSTKDIRAELGYDWSAFTHGVIRGKTPGETVEEVAARASRVLTRVLPALVDGDVALVAHGHFLRILTAVFLRQAPRFGAQISLDAGSVSVLSYYREQPAILSWNYGRELPLAPSES